MGQEIVKTDVDALPAPSEVERELVEARDRGGAPALLEVAHRASAHSEYEKRNHAKERADFFGRVVVLAEAHLGQIDAQQNRRVKRDEPLVVSGEVILESVRRKWRLLGIAMQIGRLDEAIETVRRDQWSSVTPGTVFSELYLMGWAFADPAPLRKRYHQLKRPGRAAKGQGLRAQLAQASGITGSNVSHYMRPGGRDRIPMSAAVSLAEALEVPFAELRPVPKRTHPTRQGRRQPRLRKLQGGRLDETYVLIRRALDELDRAAGTSGRWDTGEAYEHLYRAEEIVGRALKRATT